MRYFLFIVSLLLPMTTWAKPTITIGSKNFSESYLLAEILAQRLEQTGEVNVERRFGMGGTGILFQAITGGEVDIYPEYTGTLTHSTLHKPNVKTMEGLQKELDKLSLEMGPKFGLNNSYGLAITEELSKKLGITKISDLKDHPNLRMAFSYEFMERSDGYPEMIKRYNFTPKSPTRMDHSLVYTSLDQGKADVIEVYTTDSKIKKFNLVVLKDDLNFFPKYEGLYLYRKDLKKKYPQIISIVKEFEGKIDDDEMIRLNGLVEISHLTFTDSATNFFEGGEVKATSDAFWKTFWKQTRRHTLLVVIPILFSVCFGIPMGIVAAKVPFLGQFFLLLSGIVQTIPSLALLCFLIPVFGIGLVPSMIALVLYSLLPIVRGTHSGITAIDAKHHEVARVLGLSFFQKLFRIELPIASIHILSGVKTAAVMSVGMATLAAFIGAGGYGVDRDRPST